MNSETKNEIKEMLNEGWTVEEIREELNLELEKSLEMIMLLG